MSAAGVKIFLQYQAAYCVGRRKYSFQQRDQRLIRKYATASNDETHDANPERIFCKFFPVE